MVELEQRRQASSVKAEDAQDMNDGDSSISESDVEIMAMEP